MKTIVLPKLGITMTEGTITRWFKQVGDHIEKGEELFEIETDKSCQAWECNESGTLTQILLDEGETAEVGATIAILDGEVQSTTSSQTSPKREVASAQPQNTGDDSPVLSSPSPSVKTDTPLRIQATPRAKRYARMNGIDITLVPGTGERGRIREKDVIAYQQIAKQNAVPTRPDTVPSPVSSEANNSSTIHPYKGIRKITGERVWKSYNEKPHIYIKFDICMDRVCSLVEKQRAHGSAVSVSDYVLEAAVKMLKCYPELNAHFTANGIELKQNVDIGYAVNTDRGLLVPVFRNLDQYNAEGICSIRKKMVGKALSGALLPDEMTGGSFTISNMGSLGVKEFTSIINDPEVAILSVAAIEQRVFVVNDAIKICRCFTATIGVDHRAIDGALAAKALKYFKDVLEGNL